MKSIYEHVLGADFDRLHPQIQRRFGFSSSDGIASIGTGVMDEIWKGRFYTEPFLRVGSSPFTGAYLSNTWLLMPVPRVSVMNSIWKPMRPRDGMM